MTEGREHEAMILDVVKRAVAEALDRKRRLVVDECEVLALLRGKRLRIANRRRGRALSSVYVSSMRESLSWTASSTRRTRVSEQWSGSAATWPASSSRSSSVKSGNHLRSTIRNIAGNHFLPSQELIQLIQPFVAAQ
jgi:hypothetical protein